jgi:uracil-DNA glycosylase family 4
MPSPRATDLRALTAEIASCRACPRLVEWREQVAREKRASFRDETYWARPVPGFGDARARILLVGLAPAAHGGNRTGRVFTGDRSGDFLFASLHRAGLSNQAESVDANDGLQLRDAYVAAAVRCAPPANKPTPAERDACLPYLVRELALLERVRVIVALGAFGYEATWAALRTASLDGVELPARRPRFGHGAEVAAGRVTILCTFHPSQQNTFTGKLTPAMLDAVLARAVELTAGAHRRAVVSSRARRSPRRRRQGR